MKNIEIKSNITPEESKRNAGIQMEYWNSVKGIEITHDMTTDQMEEVAKEIKEIMGYDDMSDFIEALQAENDYCPEGICDGSGKVHKMGWDADAHRECNDEGDEDCLCTKDN